MSISDADVKKLTERLLAHAGFLDNGGVADHSMTSEADLLREAADALLASRGMPEGWRPIETAPKTSAEDMRAICLLGWCPDPTAPDGGDHRVIWWEPKWKGGAWNSDRDLVEHPTHWMPLPESPRD